MLIILMLFYLNIKKVNTVKFEYTEKYTTCRGKNGQRRNNSIQ